MASASENGRLHSWSVAGPADVNAQTNSAVSSAWWMGDSGAPGLHIIGLGAKSLAAQVSSLFSVMSELYGLWINAQAQCASLQGCRFEPHSCH